MLACDFFTVESVLLRRYYVSFFIAHANRRVWLAGCSPNPTGTWVTQQARSLGLDRADHGMRFLIRDRDSKYTGPFDQAFRSSGIRIVKTRGRLLLHRQGADALQIAGQCRDGVPARRR